MLDARWHERVGGSEKKLADPGNFRSICPIIYLQPSPCTFLTGDSMNFTFIPAQDDIAESRKAQLANLSANARTIEELILNWSGPSSEQITLFLMDHDTSPLVTIALESIREKTPTACTFVPSEEARKKWAPVVPLDTRGIRQPGKRLPQLDQSWFARQAKRLGITSQGFEYHCLPARSIAPFIASYALTEGGIVHIRRDIQENGRGYPESVFVITARFASESCPFAWEEKLIVLPKKLKKFVEARTMRTQLDELPAQQAH